MFENEGVSDTGITNKSVYVARQAFDADSPKLFQNLRDRIFVLMTSFIKHCLTSQVYFIPQHTGDESYKLPPPDAVIAPSAVRVKPKLGLHHHVLLFAGIPCVVDVVRFQGSHALRSSERMESDVINCLLNLVLVELNSAGTRPFSQANVLLDVSRKRWTLACLYCFDCILPGLVDFSQELGYSASSPTTFIIDLKSPRRKKECEVLKLA